MTKAMHEGPGTLTLAEMKEFAGFSAATQRYIRRSLDVAFDRKDAIARWSRDAVEVTSIDTQYLFYARLPDIEALVPDLAVLQDAEPFLAQLVTLSAFDLGQGPIAYFAAYRFCTSGCLAPMRGRGCPQHSARPHQCPMCRRASARSFCNRSVRPR